MSPDDDVTTPAEEGFYLDSSGQKQDADLWSDEGAEAVAALADGAVRRAVEGGMSPSDALALYDPDGGLRRE